MLNKTGVPDKSLVKSKFPDSKLLLKAKAITECYEEIPCNPCSTSCPFNAISIGEDINKLPVVDFEKCTGCGVCVYSCPGLAIFTVKVKEEKAIYNIPYELLPYPKVGDIWDAVNRQGDIIGDAYITKVKITKKQDRTLLVEVEVDKDLLYEFITIKERV